MPRKRNVPEHLLEKLRGCLELSEKGYSPEQIANRYIGMSKKTAEELCRIASTPGLLNNISTYNIPYGHARLIASLSPEQRDSPGLLRAAAVTSQREFKRLVKEVKTREFSAVAERYLSTGLAEIDNPDTKKTLESLGESIGAPVTIEVVNYGRSRKQSRLCVHIKTWGLDSAVDIINYLMLDDLSRPIDIITQPRESRREVSIYVQCAGVPQTIAAVQWMLDACRSNRDALEVD